MNSHITIQVNNDHICGRFSAMASPCEILIESDAKDVAMRLVEQAYKEAKRIEDKFSRYLDTSIISQINQANGRPVSLDNETFKLLTFADTCFELSQGLFDITSGVLRKIWKFDGSDNIPTAEQVDSLQKFIGWRRVKFDKKSVTLPRGFELDFGGIGKEYAVDSVAKLCQKLAPTVSVLVNFGGDVQITCPRKQGKGWQIGIEHPDIEDTPYKIIQLAQGGLATSGDARRYLLKDGVRYSHILNPKTSYPVKDAPRAVTVINQHCIQAGLITTIALLQGLQAESFLQQQQVQYWCIR